MASSLVEICDALAAIDISFTSEGISYTVTGTPLADVTDYVPSPPARLILPPGAYGPGVSEYKHVTFGGVQVTWNIVDMFLFESVALGQAVGVKYQAMAHYVAAYLPALNAVRTLNGYGIVTNVNPQVGIIEYPRGSQRYYNGVQMVVSVSENFC